MNSVRPLVDVPVGDPGVPGWQGMTIKDILEKVDLLNVTNLMEEDTDIVKAKTEINIEANDTKPTMSYKSLQEKKLIVNSSNPESAFLGPKLWKNPITLPMLSGTSGSDGAEFSVMNIDDFLNENNFDLNPISPPLPDDEILGLGKEANSQMMGGFNHQTESIGSPASDEDGMDTMDTSSISSAKWANSPSNNKSKNALPKGENSFLYAESKRAKLERERAERKRKMEVQIEFSPEELALATIPGADFDPKRRHFTSEELRPQPIIRKRKKTYVDFDAKDIKYWERREKNNVAARRSREARRLKENQIALRTAYLEKENGALKAALDKSNDENLRLSEENKKLNMQLDRYKLTFSPSDDI